MRRAVAAGALVGLVVALGFTLAMPARQVRSAEIPLAAGQRAVVYGSLGPYAPASLSRTTAEHSPRILRDALLGLLAGGLSAAALLTVLRPRPGGGG